MTGPWIAAFVAVAGLVIVLAIIVTGILRRTSATLERLDEYMQFQARTREMSRAAIGVSVPRFSSYDLQGRLVSSDQLFDVRTLVLFLGDSCQPCDELVEELMTSEVRLEGAHLMLVGRSHTLERLVERFADRPVVAFADGEAGEISRAFDNRVIPQAFVVEPPGVLAAADIPNTIRELERLVARVEGGEVSVLDTKGGLADLR